MNQEIINKYIATPETTVVEAMELIDITGKGILYVLNTDNQLVGTVTDGDTRRWLMRTGDLKACIKLFMNPEPKSIFESEIVNAHAYMSAHSITSVPVIDANRRIIDIIFADDEIIKRSEYSELLKGTDVIIMAGGKGTRLYPYTKILPKPLIPIGDVPILERIIDRFNEYGMQKFYLTVNYRKAMIKSYFADLNPDYVLKYVEEDKPLGTAGSIKLINDKLSSPVIITNCDTIVDVDYGDLVNFHISSGNALTIVSALKNIVIPYGVLHSKEEGIITSMEEKPKMSCFINTGLYVLNPEMIDKIPDDEMFHMTHLADKLMADGLQVGMYPISEEAFLDMGEFTEMKRMEKKLHIESSLV